VGAATTAVLTAKAAAEAAATGVVSAEEGERMDDWTSSAGDSCTGVKGTVLAVVSEASLVVGAAALAPMLANSSTKPARGEDNAVSASPTEFRAVGSRRDGALTDRLLGSCVAGRREPLPKARWG
jgi:hypothetical protein